MKKLYFSIILFFLCLSGFSQEWRQIQNIPLSHQSYSFSYIRFINDSVGYLTSDDGDWKALYSDDYGETWNVVNSPNSNFIDNPYFINSNKWLVFNDVINNLSISVDMGLSWITNDLSVYAQGGSGDQFSSIDFLNSDTGYIYNLWRSWALPFPFGILLRTSDGGDTWTQYKTLKDSVVYSNRITFINIKKGFGVKYYDSTNYITQFDIINDTCFITKKNISPVKTIFTDIVRDDTTVYTCNKAGSIYKSSDKGNTWLQVFNDTNININALCVKNNLGYAVGFSKVYNNGVNLGSGVILKTIDGGLNWTKEYTNNQNVLLGVGFNNPNNIFVCGENGYILKGERINSLKGLAYNDINNNNIYDNGETPLSGVVLKSVSGLQNRTFYGITGIDGKYHVGADSGNYILTIENNPQYIYNFSPLNYTGQFLSLNSIDSNKNFGFHLIPNVKDLEVYITALNIARPGQIDAYNITYKNVGTETMAGSVKLKFDTILFFSNSEPVQNNYVGNELNWNFTNLLPGTNRTITANFFLLPGHGFNDSVKMLAEIYPVINDTTPINNRDSLIQIVVTSYDPNEKIVSPSSRIKSQNISDGQWLTYTLHFQNTGADTAFNIKVADELNQNLLLSTVSVLSASDTCNLTVRGSRTLEFTFPNIKLPDSNVNRTGSNGFVKFKIKIDTNFQEGDTICNTAYIYFDYNLPVTTNTVKTYIDNYSGIRTSKSAAKETISIYPNPTTSSTNIEYNLNQPSKVNLSVYNFMGALVTTVCNEQQPAGNYKKTFNAKEFGLSAGIYFARLSVNGKSEVRKILIIDGSI